MGMGVNQKKTVIIPYDQAYGPYRSDLIRVVNRTGLIANTNFIEGQLFYHPPKNRQCCQHGQDPQYHAINGDMG